MKNAHLKLTSCSASIVDGYCVFEATIPGHVNWARVDTSRLFDDINRVLRLPLRNPGEIPMINAIEMRVYGCYISIRINEALRQEQLKAGKGRFEISEIQKTIKAQTLYYRKKQ